MKTEINTMNTYSARNTAETNTVVVPLVNTDFSCDKVFIGSRCG